MLPMLLLALVGPPSAGEPRREVIVNSADLASPPQSSEVVSATCGGLAYRLETRRQSVKTQGVQVTVGSASALIEGVLRDRLSLIGEKRVGWSCYKGGAALTVVSLVFPKGAPAYLSSVRAYFDNSPVSPRLLQRRMTLDEAVRIFGSSTDE